MASNSSGQLAIESIHDLDRLRKEYNSAVVDHVNAIMLVEVLGPLRDERMTAIYKGFGEAENKLGHKLTRLSERCNHLGGLLPPEFWLYHHPPDNSPLKTYSKDVFNHAERFFNFRKPSIPAFLCPDDILKLGKACDFDPSTIASTITSLLFDDVKLDGLLYAADCDARRIVQRAAELYDSSNMEVRRELVPEIKKIVWFRQETIKQMHELWDNRAALVFDTSHDAADDGLDDYCPFDIDLASLPRTPRPADRDPPLPTSMCEPAQRQSAALTWTLRLRVADQYWRYVHF